MNWMAFGVALIAINGMVAVAAILLKENHPLHLSDALILLMAVGFAMVTGAIFRAKE